MTFSGMKLSKMTFSKVGHNREEGTLLKEKAQYGWMVGLLELTSLY
jgi:hypothetical protein